MQQGEHTYTVKNILKGLFVVTLVFSIGTASQNSEEPWRSPCGGISGPSFGWGVPTTASSTQEILTSMAILLDECLLYAINLQRNFISSTLTPKVAHALSPFHVEGMPKMTDDETMDSLADVIQLNYEKLSTVMVFLKQVESDEKKDNFAPDRNIVNGIDGTLTVIKNVLCQKQTLLSNLGEQINYISSSVMPAKFSVTKNTMDRHFRDYLVIRDIRNLFDAMREQVENLASGQ